MFEIGEAVVHPTRGAGIVVGIQERKRLGKNRQYYTIELLGRQSTLMIPVNIAEKRGLRPALSPEKLKKVWKTLESDPESLPDNYKTRHKLMKDKIQTGEVIKVAEAIRDMAGYQREKGLTGVGRRIYRKGMSLLAGEIAAAQDIDLDEAEVRIRNAVKESVEELSE
jgi:RNA polymerase-interacting CarD/CdnL/TRCF family regulator